MKAIVIREPGDEDVLVLQEVPPPTLTSSHDVRIAVEAAGVNRADLLQRQGHYPPPPGASKLLGLECGGRVLETGSAVRRWNRGDRVMALMAGGGYAEEAVVEERSILPVPQSMSAEESGAFPETFLTAHLNIFMLGGAVAGQRVLVHGGGSGVGTSAIVLGALAGLEVIVTAGSDDKCRRCLELGASAAINYRKLDFAAEVQRLTDGAGVNIILDSIGGSYLGRNISSLARDGVLMMIGGMGGRSGELDIEQVLTRRLRIIGSTLRGRPAAEKGDIIESFLTRFGDDLATGRIRPILDRVLPLAEAAQAHRLMKSSEHFGKIVLKVRSRGTEHSD